MAGGGPKKELKNLSKKEEEESGGKERRGEMFKKPGESLIFVKTNQGKMIKAQGIKKLQKKEKT